MELIESKIERVLAEQIIMDAIRLWSIWIKAEHKLERGKNKMFIFDPKPESIPLEHFAVKY